MGSRRVRERRLRRAPSGQAPGLARSRVARSTARRARRSSRARSSSTAAGRSQPGKRYLALVDKVDGENAEVLDRRSASCTLPLRNMSWAAKWEAGNAENDKTIDSARARRSSPATSSGCRARSAPSTSIASTTCPTSTNPSWVYTDEQQRLGRRAPRRRAARAGAASADDDLHRRSPHRLRRRDGRRLRLRPLGVQPRRAGVPAARLDVQADLLLARPRPGLRLRHRSSTTCRSKIVDPDTGEEWTPTNLEDTQDGNVTLEYALVFSKNIPSVDLFRRLGAKNVEDVGAPARLHDEDLRRRRARARRLVQQARRDGARVHGVRAQRQVVAAPRRARRRTGSTCGASSIATATRSRTTRSPDDPQLAAGDRFDRFAALAGIKPPQAIPARAAFLMSKLLAHEVEFGFANVLRATGITPPARPARRARPTTPRSSRTRRSSRRWCGWATTRSSARSASCDAAYMTVVPLWARYMYEAAQELSRTAKIPWEVPPGVKPNDRGDHSKGEKGPQMDLICRAAEERARQGRRRPSTGLVSIDARVQVHAGCGSVRACSKVCSSHLR